MVVGDVVVCKYPGPFNLTEGKEYKILGAHRSNAMPDSLIINVESDIGVIGKFYSWRFGSRCIFGEDSGQVHRD